MSHELAVGLTALGLFALLIAFAVPPAIDASQSTTNDTFALAENDTVTVIDGLDMTLNDTSNTEATVDFTDVETSLTATVTLSEGNTTNVTLNDENVSVTATDTAANEAQLTVEYSPRYGWDAGAKVLAAQMDVILLLFAFILLVGGMGAVVS